MLQGPSVSHSIGRRNIEFQLMFTSDFDCGSFSHFVVCTTSVCFSSPRQLLRGAERMPTPNRRKFVMKKTRKSFLMFVNDYIWHFYISLFLHLKLASSSCMCVNIFTSHFTYALEHQKELNSRPINT